MRRALLEAVDARRQSLIETAQALVRVASPNPPSDTRAIAPVAEALLKSIPGAEVRAIESAPGIINLIARISSGRPGRRLIFNGHLDTFPIGEDLGWTVPPLSGVLRDGKLFGRGVSDMKGGVACALLAATLLAERRDAWTGEIVITLAGDEENMGALGSGFLLQNEPLARAMRTSAATSVRRKCCASARRDCCGSRSKPWASRHTAPTSTRASTPSTA